jgi:hypothetical protein
VLLRISPTGHWTTCIIMCVQDPPAEEYDQMLAFYYKWQEKEKVRLQITAVHWHHATVRIFCAKSPSHMSNDTHAASHNLA